MMSRKREMAGTVLVLLLSLVSSTFASKCTDISGNWQNELGSRMWLNISASGRMMGEYQTAIETNPGAAALVSNITGIFSNVKDGALLAFSVFFNHGSSLATWVGECLICEGEEMLYTTYILRTFVADSIQKLRSVVVNQNTFWRSEIDDKLTSIGSQVVASYDNSGADGTWTSSNNEEIKFSRMQSNPSGGLDDPQIHGKWKTVFKEEISINGISDVMNENHRPVGGHRKVMALTAVALRNERIRSWAGHITSEESSSSKMWETAWLEHEFSPTCSTPRATVLFGMTNYTQIATDDNHTLMKSETFMEKLRKFFTSMF